MNRTFETIGQCIDDAITRNHQLFLVNRNGIDHIVTEHFDYSTFVVVRITDTMGDTNKYQYRCDDNSRGLYRYYE